jgi:hypothetical protein
MSYFVKILQVEAELLHADRRTDGQTDVKLIVAFCNFANAPKNEIYQGQSTVEPG